jgi:hypothetical protein
MATLICIYCNEPFDRNKYSPRQKVCSKTECQHKRQISSMRDWRNKHPNYFKYDESKGEDWLKVQRERSKQWRMRNPDKIRAYRQTHLSEYRNYVRDYMKNYRANRKSEKSSSEKPAGS